MILFPLAPSGPEASGPAIPVWDAIVQRQKQDASAWWLVAQPDHAALAGDLAAAIRSTDFPVLEPDVLQAIALHDAGWAVFDGGGARGTGAEMSSVPSLPRANPAHRPLSFLEVPTADFLQVWCLSIDRAERIAPIGGIMVSEHFSRVGEMSLQMKANSAEEARMLRDFLRHEEARRARLGRDDGHSHSARQTLVEVLQFCDLLSLYLCCGSRETVEFPQRFGAQPLRLLRVAEVCRTEPPLFGAGVSLGVTARRYPALPEWPAVTIPFLLT